MEYLSETKQCQNCKQDFIIEPDDFAFYEKIKVPAPTFCPECRLQRRLAFRNERSLYKRPCDMCGADIICMFSPVSPNAKRPFTVYCHNCFYSDKWDPMDYGKKYDSNKSFFEQWREIQEAIPHLGLFQQNSVNSPWINYELDDKNCYLNFGGHFNEDSAYSQYLLKSKDCIDNFWLMNSQFGYESTLSENCYKIFFSIFCFDCQDTYFSFDCKGCYNIYGCTGLRHKQNYIFNKPVSKEDFQKFIEEKRLGTYTNFLMLKKQAEDFWKSQPQRANYIDKSVSSSGNIIKDCKNCNACWNAEKTEDSKFILYGLNIKDSHDTTSVWGGEKCYDFIAGSEQLSNVRFSTSIIKSSTNIEYSHYLTNCHNCFGCINLTSKSLCILNTQYTKDEFEVLRKKIIEEMCAKPYTDSKNREYPYGEFFPYEHSPFGYNETVANQYFPLEKKEAEELGFNWNNYESETKHEFSDYQILNDIKDAGDDVLEKVLKCEISGKAFRIIPMELQFYKKFDLPLPRVSPFERHAKRLSFIKDHLKLYNRQCFGCKKPTETVYTELEFPMIYCEQCYLKETY